MLTPAYAAMRMFARRASDYMRSASADDRRYLLYNPMVKMKVTTQGEEVINLLWDVIAARGFEKDTYFEMAAKEIRVPAQTGRHRPCEHGADRQIYGQLFFQPG
jgi:acyl-CoA dehydrogenase